MSENPKAPQEKETLSLEQQLHNLIEKMKKALSQEKSADFKSFWEAKHQCLELFKENIPYTLRATFWEEYVNLSNEARKLQEIQDEQTAFTLEQISLALEATKKDLEQFTELLKQMPQISFPSLKPMEARYPLYQALQKELNLLNSFSSRIQALRKEILKVPLSFKKKGQLLQTLSTLGDQVFPQRKQLIEKLSELFEKDVCEFIEKSSKSSLPFYLLRQDIQAFQALAKLLTINPKAFNTTRLKLSETWDLIRIADEERKQQVREKQKVSEKSILEAESWIKAFTQELSNLSEEAIQDRTEELKEKLLRQSLEKRDFKILEEKLHHLSLEAITKIHKEKEDKIREKDLKKREQLDHCKSSIEKLISEAENLSLESLSEQLNSLQKEIQTLTLSRDDQLLFKRILKPIKDLVEEKKEREAFSRISSEKVNITELQDLLEERKEKRSEIKNQIEQYRKTIAKSGFDFEEAMMYREMLEVEKQRLDQAEALIAEIERQLFSQQE